MNRIKIDLDRTLGYISPHIFGGFAELLGHVIYGGIYDPESPLADKDGLRSDVKAGLERLNYTIVRFPGGNFVSGYRWMDGIGPPSERPARHDLAWNNLEPNLFGTDEFIRFCRKMNIEPYLCVNCGDGNMREAADWVEYCNGTLDTALVKLRRKNGFDEPHKVKYWGIGNEVDGPWQIGQKTAYEYARAFTEFGKVMKWTDPDIKLISAANCIWGHKTVEHLDWVERGQLILEHAGNLVDYMALHWYVGNEADDYYGFMAVSELYEERLSVYEGLIKAMCLERNIRRQVPITVDEWGIRPHRFYSMEDALVTAMNLNAFIRHSHTVKMANLTMLITPMHITPDGVVLQTIFYPFELYWKTCGQEALDIQWESETFSATCEEHEFSGIRHLDVTATLDQTSNKLVIYAVNHNEKDTMETAITLSDGQFSGEILASVINGADIKTENSVENPDRFGVTETKLEASGNSFTYSFEPHSITALECDVT